MRPGFVRCSYEASVVDTSQAPLHDHETSLTAIVTSRTEGLAKWQIARFVTKMEDTAWNRCWRSSWRWLGLSVTKH